MVRWKVSDIEAWILEREKTQFPKQERYSPIGKRNDELQFCTWQPISGCAS